MVCTSLTAAANAYARCWQYWQQELWVTKVKITLLWQRLLNLFILQHFLHDDVVDESNLRRGTPTANAEFGNAASVLVGDFIYTRSFQLMVGLGKMQIMQVLADATNVIAEGEVLQLMNCNDPNTTEASYMQVIYSKTAKLFEAATGLAGYYYRAR